MVSYTNGHSYNVDITDPTGTDMVAQLNSSNSYDIKIPLSDLQTAKFNLSADTLTIAINDASDPSLPICSPITSNANTIIFGGSDPGGTSVPGPPTVTLDPKIVTTETKSVKLIFSNLTTGTYYSIHTLVNEDINYTKELANFTASGDSYTITVCATVAHSLDNYLTTDLANCDPFKNDSYYSFTINILNSNKTKWQTIGGGTIYVGKGSGKPGAPGQNPCSASSCDTAIGSIPTNLGDFASAILRIALGISGGIILILMVIGSIRVMTSSGDPQRTGAGRDMIIAAVAGALFIAFSVMILEFLGVAVVPIPGLKYFSG